MTIDRNVIFDVSPDSVKKAADAVANQDQDSLLVIAPFSGHMSMHAPAKRGKYKGYHRIKCEIWIPEAAIQGTDALIDFGALALLRLPKSRVQEHLKKDRN